MTTDKQTMSMHISNNSYWYRLYSTFIESREKCVEEKASRDIEGEYPCVMYSEIKNMYIHDMNNKRAKQSELVDK